MYSRPGRPIIVGGAIAPLTLPPPGDRRDWLLNLLLSRYATLGGQRKDACAE